jgi:hypothetical protein
MRRVGRGLRGSAHLQRTGRATQQHELLQGIAT